MKGRSSNELFFTVKPLLFGCFWFSYLSLQRNVSYWWLNPGRILNKISLCKIVEKKFSIACLIALVWKKSTAELTKMKFNTKPAKLHHPTKAFTLKNASFILNKSHHPPILWGFTKRLSFLYQQPDWTFTLGCSFLTGLTIPLCASIEEHTLSLMLHSHRECVSWTRF